MNVLMLTLLLAMVGSAELFRLVGGMAIVMAGLHFLGQASGRTVRRTGRGHLYNLVLLWVPGLIALVLSVAALSFVTVNRPGSPAYILAVAMFGCEIVMLVVGSAERDDAAPSRAATR